MQIAHPVGSGDYAKLNTARFVATTLTVKTMAKIYEGFNCERCGHHAAATDIHGQQIKREYNGKTVCVGCYSHMKLKNGDYGNE